MTRTLLILTLLIGPVGSAVSSASAQSLEAIGSRALGMGGAFVAVASDATATWWNPAGLAAGPFVDLAFGAAFADIENGLPARRERTASFAVATPPLGLSYYRLKVLNISPFHTIEPGDAGREDRGVAVPASSLSASQYGVTLVQTVAAGVHVGATLKYVRGAGTGSDVAGLESMSSSDWFERASRLDEGEAGGAFDLDVGVLAVHGPIRLGGVVRNAREAEFGDARLPRQIRVGVAFDASEAAQVPVTVALDADARAYATPSGDRRVVAVGGEGWVMERRVGLRAGARINTVQTEERAFTAGTSVAVRSGLYVEAHVAYGGARGEGGWGVTARASF